MERSALLEAESEAVDGRVVAATRGEKDGPQVTASVLRALLYVLDIRKVLFWAYRLGRRVPRWEIVVSASWRSPGLNAVLSASVPNIPEGVHQSV